MSANTTPECLSASVGKRVVTVRLADGRSAVHAETTPPAITDYAAIPGMRTSVLWASTASTPLGTFHPDPVPTLKSLHPAPGGSVFMTLTLPPDSVYMSPSFDPAAAGAEQARAAPGLAELFEPDAPGFHTTATVDYVVVLDGPVWLETDAQEVMLNTHDVVVQNGTRHAWRNHGAKSATLAVVLIGLPGPAVAPVAR